ncbi:MAG: ribulose-phosphate 3-epimerase [Candidatus Niyogibacteria bacterium]|nr:ribulose-phosphate 3-epimerase [Candidatus Niyogibacteria bacterium]
MVQIIPAINAENFSDVAEKIKKIEPYAQWAHLDVADGTFTPNVLWHNSAELVGLATKLKLEVHLMLGDIDGKIDPWLAAPGVVRIIFHVEAARDVSAVIARCRAAGKEVGLSLRPETDVRTLAPYFDKIDLVQILAVPPGRAGQGFDENALQKIVAVRAACPRCIIEVDGGMKIGTAALAKKAGADIIVAASAIFNAADIEQAIKNLQDDTLA